jgi:hypothetical protein
MEMPNDNWPDPSHMYVGFIVDGNNVCGVLFSSALGVSRLDRSLLYGSIASGHMEVRYASSYYQDQNQVATAVLERNGEKLRWQPTTKGLSSSWFWGATVLSRVETPYVPLTREIQARCTSLRDKKSIDALDLYLDP